MRIRVLFPAPDRPIMPKISPRSIRRLTPARACDTRSGVAYVLRRFSRTIKAGGLYTKAAAGSPRRAAEFNTGFWTSTPKLTTGSYKKVVTRTAYFNNPRLPRSSPGHDHLLYGKPQRPGMCQQSLHRLRVAVLFARQYPKVLSIGRTDERVLVVAFDPH